MRALHTIFLLVVLGYYFFGKPWAYTYSGELILVGFSVVFMSFLLLRLKIKKGFPVLLYLLIGLALGQLLLNFGEYKLDAVRDSVIILYAIFAVVMFNTLPDLKITVEDWLGYMLKFLRYLPIYYLTLTIVKRLLPGALYVPSLGFDLLYVKPGDIGVHIAFVGIAFFLGIFSFRSILAKNIFLVSLVSMVLYCAAYNRAGFLSFAVAFGLMLLIKREWRYIKYAGATVVVAVLVLVILSNSSYSKEENFQGRSLSVDQITTNFESILQIGELDLELDMENQKLPDPTLANIAWRLIWWMKIVKYTFFGEYFWFGKGVGINLADSDGIHGTEGLRSPHNGHLTILARYGVVGFLLWVTWLVSCVVYCLSQIRRLGRFKMINDQNTLLLLFCYWVAFLVNASFDVFLEGPMGGIPFWMITGLLLLKIKRVKLQAV